MSSRNDEVREFLSTRRAKITPQAAGLPAYGGKRRVKGLRREEVALLAGISADYYTRLEKGRLTGVSDSVLGAIAGALRLDEAERTYLFDLARTANAGVVRNLRPAAAKIRLEVQRVLDSMITAAACVCNGRLDIIGTNLLARALYSPAFDSPARSTPLAPPNIARFNFLDPNSPAFYPDFNEAENTAVQLLRAQAGRTPYDKQLTDLVGELTTRSDSFARRWASHDVRVYRTGLKRFSHPVVGEIAVSYEAMELLADEGLTMMTYTAEPGTADDERLRLLATWATTERADLR
ncbi:helix-turn-helix transcriptional regulator [Streptomyces sp. H23]|uniref:helix-turn-helix domain-containing protein n=1 Tax=Streptomyces TaxID=1883 RepID=UPI00106E109F|nr:helix-turn-helix transcriptional regulator [Streptomyces sp. H23]